MAIILVMTNEKYQILYVFLLEFDFRHIEWFIQIENYLL